MRRAKTAKSQESPRPEERPLPDHADRFSIQMEVYEAEYRAIHSGLNGEGKQWMFDQERRQFASFDELVRGALYRERSQLLSTRGHLLFLRTEESGIKTEDLDESLESARSYYAQMVKIQDAKRLDYGFAFIVRAITLLRCIDAGVDISQFFQTVPEALPNSIDKPQAKQPTRKMWKGSIKELAVSIKTEWRIVEANPKKRTGYRDEKDFVRQQYDKYHIRAGYTFEKFYNNYKQSYNA